MNLNKNAMWLLVLGLIVLNVDSLNAQEGVFLNSPKKFDRDKISLGFQYRFSRRSPYGAIKAYQVNLDPGGELVWSGNYLGDSDYDCSNQGGKVVYQIGAKEHGQIAEMALRANNENQGEKVDFEAYHPDAPLPTLSTEIDNQYGYVNIVKTDGSDTKAFNDMVRDLPNRLFKESKAKISSLSLDVNRDFKSRNVKVVLSNSGNEKISIQLPKNAGEHFYLRYSNGERVPLEYGKNQKNVTQTLVPGKSLDVSLFIPKQKSPSGGLIVYDNSSPAQNNGDNILGIDKNSVKVALCALSKEGVRVEKK